MYVPTPAQGVQIGICIWKEKGKNTEKEVLRNYSHKNKFVVPLMPENLDAIFFTLVLSTTITGITFLIRLIGPSLPGITPAKEIPDQTSFKQCFIGSHFKKLSFLSRISTNNNNELDFNSTNFLYPVTHSIGAPVQWLCSTKDKTNPNIHIRKRCSLSPHVNKSLTPTSCYFFAIDRPLSVLPMAHKTPSLFIVR